MTASVHRAILVLALGPVGIPAAVEAQDGTGEAVLAELEAGRVEEALRMLDAGRRPTSEELRLRVAEGLGRFAPGLPAARREKALATALALVQAGPRSPELRRRSFELQLDLATARARALRALRPPGSASPTWEDRLLHCLAAQAEALAALGREDSPTAIAIDLERAERLLGRGRPREVVRLAERRLSGAGFTKADRRHLRGLVGQALLRLGEPRRAAPLLADYLAKAPTQATRILGVVEALPLELGEWRLRFLSPVLGRDPEPGEREAWRRCLAEAYRTLEFAGVRREPGRSFFEDHTVRLPFPRRWPARRWRKGYRVWRPDNTTPSKTYAGRHALRVVKPLSAGWRRTAPPEELRRWDNSPWCLRRGAEGPVLVIYWFGPDLHYWYGTTPARRGVTGKTARGHNRAGIASLVEEVAYGVEAKARGLRFRPARPLPFRLGAGRSAIRKAWREGDRLHDEAFFSVGQITVEVLLVVAEEDLERLEPELRFLYRHLTVE